jgi:predicted deacylase
MLKIADSFEVVKRLPNGFEVYVKETETGKFLDLVSDAVLLEQNIHADFADKATQNYKKFSDVERDLNSFANSYKEITSLLTYGKSQDGKNLYALKVDTKVNQGKKTELMITAATHGDELITVEVLIALMNELFSQYGKDSRITKMLDNHVIYFIPVVSPDSFESRSRYVEGTDPNRAYPWPEKPNKGPVTVINSLIDFTNQHQLIGSLDMHAYGRLVMYPWGYTTLAPASADSVVMNDLVLDMAKENNYTAGQISTTIYVAKGSSADYYYWNKKTRAIAVEIGNEKVPNYSKIPSMVNESREMIFRFIESFN